MVIRLLSDVFNEGELIPENYTCDGENISPPLNWNTLPEHTISFAILCEDPNIAEGTLTHWIIFNLTPDIQNLPAGVKNQEKLEGGAIQGINDLGYVGYSGPCPPSDEEHRYIFRIYALDTTLNIEGNVKRDEFLKALEYNVLDEGELTGIFGR